MKTTAGIAALAIGLAGCAAAPPHTPDAGVGASYAPVMDLSAAANGSPPYAQAEPRLEVAKTAPVMLPAALQATPIPPVPNPFRPAACDWPNARQGVGAC